MIKMKPSCYGMGMDGGPFPLLECQCDAHWKELDWKIVDCNKTQKELAASEHARYHAGRKKNKTLTNWEAFIPR